MIRFLVCRGRCSVVISRLRRPSLNGSAPVRCRSTAATAAPMPPPVATSKVALVESTRCGRDSIIPTGKALVSRQPVTVVGLIVKSSSRRVSGNCNATDAGQPEVPQ